MATCSEPLVWTCKACGHSFHEKEWVKAGRKCPACERTVGNWKCSQCLHVVGQPSLGSDRFCLRTNARAGHSFFLNKPFTEKVLFGGILVFSLATVGVASFWFLNQRPLSTPAPSAPSSKSLPIKEDPATEEQGCSEGFVAGIVYDADGPVNLREGPSTTARVVRQLESGTKVTFREFESEKNEHGWKETYPDDLPLDRAPDMTFVHETRLFMRVKNVDPDPPTRIWAGPGFDTAVIGTVAKDIPLYVQSGAPDAWVVVVAGDETHGFVQGFLRRDLIRDPSE